jgi:DNA-binding transcriptional MerR regulator
MTPLHLLLAPGAVARRLELSPSRVAQLDREGKLVALRDSAGRRLYDPETVEAFARAREARRAQESDRRPTA